MGLKGSGKGFKESWQGLGAECLEAAIFYRFRFHGFFFTASASINFLITASASASTSLKNAACTFLKSVASRRFLFRFRFRFRHSGEH